jgi:hypothetical protein
VLLRIVSCYALVQLFACLWDLPGDHGWENDGIAPRGLFSGLSGNLTPGSAHRYPLLHYVLSLLVSLPALLGTPLVAGSLERAQLLAAGNGPVVMTGVSLAIKLLSIVMSSVSVLALASFARRTADAPAGRWCALFYTVNLSLSYYGRTSNLDGPYLMWTALLLQRLPHALSAAHPESHRCYAQLGMLAAAAMATKDQAYAAVLPLLAVASLRRPTRSQLRSVLTMFGALLGTYAIASGALFNPTGFVARVKLLAGPNSQDWKVYEQGWRGLAANLGDIAGSLSAWWWPWPGLLLALLGLLLALVWSLRDRRMEPLLPLMMALGSSCLFTLIVRRTEHRFVLPVALAACYYAGLAASALRRAAAPRASARRPTLAGLWAVVILSALPCIALIATQWADGRRGLAAWLAARPRGTHVEIYGLPVYQPHFEIGPSASYHVTRVQPPAAGKPAALRGVPTVDSRYGDVGARQPDVVLIAEGFATRFFARELRPGERISRQVENAQQDTDAVRFFRAAVSDQLDGYRLAWIATAQLPAPLRWLGLRPISVHGSTAMRTWVLVRR